MSTDASLTANNGECPLWGVRVAVSGYYRECEGKWLFMKAVCPIVENSKLPIWEQDEEYKYMFCKDRFSCPLYTQFQDSITSDI